MLETFRLEVSQVQIYCMRTIPSQNGMGEWKSSKMLGDKKKKNNVIGGRVWLQEKKICREERSY